MARTYVESVMIDHAINLYDSANHDVRRHYYYLSPDKRPDGVHPHVELAIMRFGWPDNIELLVKEWPHMASDGERVAFFQSPEKGNLGRKTVTTPGRYLARTMPQLKDHQIRDIVAAKKDDEYKILRTVSEIVDAVNRGPNSCMCWTTEKRNWPCDIHPYETYDPKYGWGLAVRLRLGGVEGRALVNDNSMTFVRSFGRQPGSSYSDSDHALQGWLVTQGYTHASGWDEGTKLARIEGRRGLVFPYIDGGNNKVDEHGGYLMIDEDGEYECDHTDGSAEGSGREQCEDCGNRFSYARDDDAIHAGRYEDRCICGSCAQDYVYAYGRRNFQYYLPEGDAIEVDGEYYDPDYLSDNNIVELANGEYCDLDNAFLCEISEEWYHTDEMVSTEDGKTVCKDYAWKCELSNLWWSSNVDSTTYEGMECHPEAVEEELARLAQEDMFNDEGKEAA